MSVTRVESIGGGTSSDGGGDPLLVMALLAVAGPALGGVLLSAAQPEAHEAWLETLTSARPDFGVPLRLTESQVTRSGGVGLLAARAVAPDWRTQMAGSDIHAGRMLQLVGAERWSTAVAGRLVTACDAHARNGQGSLLIAVDTSCDGDEAPPALLLERLAFSCRIVGPITTPAAEVIRRIADARARLDRVDVPDHVLGSLAAVAAALGIVSSRTDVMAAIAARAHAAWRGADVASEEDAEVSARLVLAHRARQVPQVDASTEPREDDQCAHRPHSGGSSEPTAGERQVESSSSLDDRVVAAAAAAIPANLLERLNQPVIRTNQAGMTRGRARGGQRKSVRGRPIGSVRGDPRQGSSLDLIATIQAAAPWQMLRRRVTKDRRDRSAARRVLVWPSDIRVVRYKSDVPATTVFAIDASGSSALHRMAEAKGAIELMLAQCYVRRDSVAVVAFRGARANVVLPPTRALARARRALAELPGGGGTPLASGIEAAHAIALAARRSGEMALVVLLTDGRANIALDCTPDRVRAAADAVAVGRRIAADGLGAILIDTSPSPGSRGAELASAMNARYVALPHALATEIAGVVGAAGAERRCGR